MLLSFVQLLSCYSCSACLCCGRCKFCGPGKKKQCSLKWCCLAMKAEILSPPSSKRKEQFYNATSSSYTCFLIPLFQAISQRMAHLPLFQCLQHNSSWLSNQSGHMLHPVKGDGNCMFWCFSHYLLGNEEEHDTVQTLIIQCVNQIVTIVNHFSWTTMGLHKKLMLQKCAVPSLGEHIETACLFQVPVYECVYTIPGW